MFVCKYAYVILKEPNDQSLKDFSQFSDLFFQFGVVPILQFQQVLPTEIHFTYLFITLTVL